jgi:Xaa-Pro aminopeptidase
MSSPLDALPDLARRLGEAGRPTDPQALANLLQGIAAAPDSLAGPEWLELVAPGADAALRKDLLAARAACAAPEEAIAAGPAEAAARLAALRATLAQRGLAGFIVPRADEHQGEYVPKNAQRLAWLTGFTGSAGWAVVLRDSAALFVDGRYTLQARQQVDTTLFTPIDYPATTPDQFLARTLAHGDRFGFDPWLHGLAETERLQRACAQAGAELVPLDSNPLDAVWSDRPARPIAPVQPQPLELAGETSEDKRARIARTILDKGAAAALLTAPDSIAWLLNVRGGDVPRTPFPLSFALVRSDGQVDLFVDRRKLPERTLAWLGNGVSLADPADLGPALDAHARDGKPVLLDEATAPYWAVQRLQDAGGTVVRGADPVALPKACKNDVELAGIRAAHARDGVAVSRFLHFLGQRAPSGTLREIEASDRLQHFREETGAIRDLSFDTISGAGPNGAIVHYRASPQSERTLAPGELYLVDSGGQYRDGTTDVTRTVAVGTPSPEMRDRFTRVLKGHIALAMARFPVGTTGSQLDALARYHLWQAGLDYDHGTGHGVGAYLSVHEGPHRISKVANTVALQPGMIVSNEPGYYKAGAYGIRIENLVAVKKAEIEGADRAYLEFETLTLAPIDRNCIDKALLTAAEIAWLDAYHARVRAAHADKMPPEVAAWLAEVTQPL